MPALKRAVPAWPAPSQRHPSLVWYEMGTAHLRAGRLDEAIAALDTALRLRPAFPEALRVGGTILRDQGASEAALGFLGEAIRLRPGYRDAVLDKSNLLLDLGRDQEALATLDAALAHRPDAGLLCNKGSILDGLGHLPEACAALQAAIATDPALPEAHLNYGAALMRLFRHAEALPVLDRALALRPTSSAAHANRGLALKMLSRFDEAAAALERALALEPDNAYALTNRGELRLLLGNCADGWPDYQARLATEWHNAPLLASPVGLWAGEPLQGLRVLAVADAGNGDILQFARYVPMLVAAGARVTIVCKGRLHRLLAPLFRGTRVVERADDAETFDCLVPFSSLPFVFATDTASIPAQVPYLAAEPSRVASWRDLIGTRGLRIGLCWRGSQDWRSDPNRSIALAAFAPLAALPDVRLVALNIDTEGMDTADVPLLRFDDLDAGPDAFVDTAAIMTQLDLVVTIDTSLAHLAGALGRPTFLLLRKVPDWRWLLDRDDTPWYPTMRLLRQERTGDWTAPLAHLVEAVSHVQQVLSPALRVTRLDTSGATARSRSTAWRATRAPGSGLAEASPLVAAS